MCFLDLEKAFDRIPRRRLWQALSDPVYNIPTKLIKAARSLYESSMSMVKSDTSTEGWFNVGCGVKQGSVVSPLLCILYMDNIMRKIYNNDVTEIWHIIPLILGCAVDANCFKYMCLLFCVFRGLRLLLIIVICTEN